MEQIIKTKQELFNISLLDLELYKRKVTNFSWYLEHSQYSGIQNPYVLLEHETAVINSTNALIVRQALSNNTIDYLSYHITVWALDTWYEGIYELSIIQIEQLQHQIEYPF